jgi:hypothetical protein
MGIVGILVFMKVGILSEGAGASFPGATVLGRLKGWLLGVLAMLAQSLRCTWFPAPPVPPRKARGGLDPPFCAVPDLAVSGRGTLREISTTPPVGRTRDMGDFSFSCFPVLYLSLFL